MLLARVSRVRARVGVDVRVRVARCGRGLSVKIPGDWGGTQTETLSNKSLVGWHMNVPS